MQWGNRIIFIILLLASAGGIYNSLWGYGVGNIARPGVGFFPLLTASFMGLFSFILLVRYKNEEKKKIWAELKWPRAIYGISVMFLYAVFLERLGFLLSTFILFTFLSYTMESPKWYFAVGGSLLLALIFELSFRILLGIPLPRWVLEIY